jgi:hypothetical protein
MNRNRQQTIALTAQLHRENLRKNLQRRLDVARSQGNDSLVRQLEAEANYIG